MLSFTGPTTSCLVGNTAQGGTLESSDPEGSDPAGFDPAGLSVKVNTEVLRFSLTSIHEHCVSV